MKNNSSWDYDIIENTTLLIKDGTHNPPIRLQEGIPLLSAQNIVNGQISFENITYISKNEYDKIHKYYKIKKGDVLLTIVGTLGNCAVVNIGEPFSLQRSVAILRFNENIILNEFFKQYSQHHDFKKQLSMRSKKAVQTGIYLNDIKTMKIPVPPLIEQRGIAEVLGTVDEAVRLTDQVIERNEALKLGLMQWLFTQGIGHTEFKDTPLGKIPKTWKIEKVSKIFKLRKNNKNLPEEIANIPMDKIPEKGIYPEYTIEKTSDIKSGIYCEEGDLLITKITPSFENGKQAIVPPLSTKGAISTTEVIPLIPKEGTNTFFFFYNFKRKFVRDIIASRMEGSTGRQRVPTNVILDFQFGIPPIEEQNKIAKLILSHEEKIHEEEEKLLLLKKIKQGLMQVLLSGNVRVELRKDGLHRVGNNREAYN